MFGFELAYIDPGSGSLIIQAAIATIVAAAVFFAARSPGCCRAGAGATSPTRRRRLDAEPETSTSTSVDDAAHGG